MKEGKRSEEDKGGWSEREGEEEESVKGEEKEGAKVVGDKQEETKVEVGEIEGA